MKTVFLALFFAAFLPFFSETNAQNAGLFEATEPLEMSISGDIKTLMKDRSDEPKLHSISIKLTEKGQKAAVFAAEARTRGHFRRTRGRCEWMPLMLHFSQNGEQSATVFRDQKKTKLIMPCRDGDYVVREWLAYRLFNLFTEQSFRARLIKLTLVDDKNDKKHEPFLALLLEEADQLANRNSMISIEKKLRPKELDEKSFMRLAVFQYMIGNTDWSVQYLHNIRIMAKDSTSTPVAVPYDFDHSGLVDAPYAKPAEALFINSVRERLYRGYCVKDKKTFDPTIAECMAAKPKIYAEIDSAIYLNEKSRKQIAEYLDSFFETINDEKKWQKDFACPCDPNGTSNVIIQGLKKD